MQDSLVFKKKKKKAKLSLVLKYALAIALIVDWFVLPKKDTLKS